jgi:hypothetical protein
MPPPVSLYVCVHGERASKRKHTEANRGCQVSPSITLIPLKLFLTRRFLIGQRIPRVCLFAPNAEVAGKQSQA